MRVLLTHCHKGISLYRVVRVNSWTIVITI